MTQKLTQQTLVDKYEEEIRQATKYLLNAEKFVTNGLNQKVSKVWTF
jgi:hypothetical protein